MYSFIDDCDKEYGKFKANTDTISICRIVDTIKEYSNYFYNMIEKCLEKAGVTIEGLDVQYISF